MNILDVFFPKRCLGCGKVGKYFCFRCASLIRFVNQNETICPVCEKPAIDGVTHPRCQTRYSLDGLTSFFHYDGTIRKAIKTLKFRFVSDLAKEFVGLIPHTFLFLLCHPREGGDPSTAYNSQPWIPGQARNDNKILIPIPLHPFRKRERGFNQAEVLGKFLAQRFHVPMEVDALKRTKETLSQVAVKDREKRLKNMEGVFAIQHLPVRQAGLSFSIQHSHIVLFDDVWTTGATMRSAANTLKRAGARFVWGVTMAR